MGALYGTSVDTESELFERLDDDARIYAQRVWLRLQTRRGTYRKNPNYGIDFTDYLLGKANLSDPLTIERIQNEVSDQLELDPQTRSATTVATATPLGGGKFKLSLAITAIPYVGQPANMNVEVKEDGLTLR